MSSKRPRGSTLLTVLFCAVALGLICLSMASAMLSHYNLAVRNRDSAQADWIARAGVAEFIHRCAGVQKDHTDVTTVPDSVLPAFRSQPVLLYPSAHIPGKVTLLLDGMPASRDNSLSAFPGQSSFDTGDRKSIPPFSLDLALKVEWGGRTFVYQALVQQRWPYAVTAPGPVFVCGRSDQRDENGLVQPALRAPSQVKGSILAMQDSAVVSQQRIVELESDPNQNVDQNSLYRLLCPFSNPIDEVGASQLDNSHRLVVGGKVRTFAYAYQTYNTDDGPRGSFSVQPRPEVDTRDARLEGNADTYENGEIPVPANYPLIEVGANSVLTGTKRPDVRPGGLDPRQPATRDQWAKLFERPPVDGWEDIQARVTPPVGELYIPKNVIISKQPPGTVPPNTIYIQAATGKVSCDNLKLKPGCTLTVTDCSVYCKGDLVVSHENLEEPGRSPVLSGSGATLIVKQLLMVDGGEVFAGDTGMVIWADHFLLRASGRYHGAIISPCGGAFFGQTDSPDPGLHIRGAVLLGSNDIRFRGKGFLNDEGQQVGGLPTRSLAAFTLASTEVVYDPQYLRGLNQFGGFHLQALNRR